MKHLLRALIILCLAAVASAQTGNTSYPETNLAPAYAADTGSVNSLVAQPATCPEALNFGFVIKVVPANANTLTTPTLNVCGFGAKTITKFGQQPLASGDLITSAIAFLLYDGTDFELQNPQTGGVQAVTSLTTNGSSGASTLISGVLNIPNYGTA